MIFRMLTLAAACAGLAACANPPAPVAMPQSMSLPPAPLASGAMNRPSEGATGAGSAMGAFTPPPGSGSLAVGQPDQAGNNMGIPESSMGNLRRPAPRPTPRPR